MVFKMAARLVRLGGVSRWSKRKSGLFDRFVRGGSVGASNECRGRGVVGFRSYSTVVDGGIGVGLGVEGQGSASSTASGKDKITLGLKNGPGKGSGKLTGEGGTLPGLNKKEDRPEKGSGKLTKKDHTPPESKGKNARPQNPSSESSKKGEISPGSSKKKKNTLEKNSSKSTEKGETPPGSKGKNARPQNPSSEFSKKGGIPPGSSKNKKNSPKASSTLPKKSRPPENLALWLQFNGFTPRPDARFSKEFSRLAQHCKWDKEDCKKYRILLFDPEFDGHCDDDASSLESWQLLCHLCSINPAPDSIPKCKNALDSIFVNIYKAENAKLTGKPHLPFKTFQEFLHYTMKPGNRYPLKKAKKDEQKRIFLKRLKGDATQ